MQVTNQTIVSNGINATNEQRQAAVEAQARAIIQNILMEQNNIKTYRSHITGYQEQLKKLSLNIISDVDVLGSTLPSTLNANQQTIAKAIQQTNESCQSRVKEQTTEIINSITSWEQSIKGCEDRIAKLREQLSALSVDVVTADQVLG